MGKWFGLSFWQAVARIVLRNRIAMIGVIIAATILLASQWKYIRFTYTEANLLPGDHEVNVTYDGYLEKFGEEGNLIVLGIADSVLFTPKVYKYWQELMSQLRNQKEVTFVVSVDNLKNLQRNDSLQKFELQPLVDTNQVFEPSYLENVRKHLFTQMPFYDGLLLNKQSGTFRSAIYIDKLIVNTPKRKDFILQKVIPAISQFERQTNTDVRVSGMPYIRTMNTETIKSEIGFFIGMCLLVTSLLFFFFFRSFRATLVSVLIVAIGVMWSFGVIGLLGYQITVLTALVPSLIIVIGIPNCIFLTNKYHQEYKIHKNKVKALQRVTTKIGMATLITNITTAIGFATFVTSNNKILIEFGIVTAVNILLLFCLCIIFIPVFHSYIPAPKPRHIKHLERGSVKSFMDWMLRTVKHRRFSIYTTAIGLLVIGIIGIYEMRISGSIIEDMPKKADFFQDIVFFEGEFNGVMPIEIMVDTKRKQGVMKLSTLRQIDEFEQELAEIPQISKPLSVVSLVKYAKQSYYNNNPEYFDLPTAQEQGFILPYAKNAVQGNSKLLESYVDSTGQFTRITVFVKDETGSEIAEVEKQIKEKALKVFPAQRFDVTLTGKALVFQKGTAYLLENLVWSLLFAFALTAVLVALMFRSVKMVLVSLIPNMLPLLMTAGLMGFLNIPLKPSTILVFGIAFGMSVDDTIRFLSQYREELKKNNWKISKSVYATFSDAGLSMFYTSIVLLFGFSVFMLSDFGGTIALGGLVSLTLLFGMLSNLMLLPSLVLTLNKTLISQQDYLEPVIDIHEHSDAEIDEIENKS
jgi:predicted RND superfamily exporter protein